MQKTISIPEELDAQVTRLTQQLQLSESELYARAMRSYLVTHTRAEITRKLNEVYSDPENAATDPFIVRSQYLRMTDAYKKAIAEHPDTLTLDPALEKIQFEVMAREDW